MQVVASMRRVQAAAIGVLFAGACETASRPLPSQRFDDPPGSTKPYVPSWRVIGPMSWDCGPGSVGSEALSKALDIPAASWEPSLIADPSRSLRVDAGQDRTATDSLGEIKLHKFFPRFECQRAFAAAEIVSAEEQNAALLIEADDAIKVWINGRPIHTNFAARRLQQFEDYVPVRLRQGKNTILLKLARGRSRGGAWDSWSFAVGVRSLRGAREERVARTLLQEIQSSVVRAGERLAIDLRLHSHSAKIDLVISDNRASVVKRASFSGGARRLVDVADLADGLYQSRVVQSATSETFPFYKGDVVSAVETLLVKTKALRADRIGAANLAALEERFKHLHKAEHLKPHDHLWQAKVVQIVAGLTSIHDALRRREPPFRDVPGTHLRGVPSRIDNATQYYILHVPRSYRRVDGPLPLVLIQPYKFETLRPFLESIPVAEVSVLGMLGRIADRLGLAFLWMDNRGNTSGSDFGETDMFDAVDQVARDYAIDRERLYLFGSCAGGREALSLAAKYPHRFAAVGTMSPTSSYRPYAPETGTDPFGETAYRQKTPVVRMENLSHVPVYAVHGDQNSHNPLWESVKLKEIADKVGIPFELEVVPGATHLRFPTEPRAMIFQWFKGRRRERHPKRVVLTTSSLRYNRAYWLEIESMTDASSEARIEAEWRHGNLHVESRNVASYRLAAGSILSRKARFTIHTNGVASSVGPVGRRRVLKVVVESERRSSARVKTSALPGPIWDVFTGPVLVVVGTGDGDRSAAAARADAEEFTGSWRSRFLGVLAAKTDVAVTIADLRDSHVLLFGPPRPESILGPLAAQLPFKIVDGKVEMVGGRRYADPTAVQFIYPNPIDRERYLVNILNPERINMPTDAVQLALKGWYDYALWSRTSGQTVVQDAGTFDSNWSRPISKIAAVVGASTP